MNQQESLDFLAHAHAKSAIAQGETELTLERLEKLFSRFGVKPEQVSTRGLESEEMSSEVKSILTRTKFFGKTANEVFEKLYPTHVTPPTHLIHVTCTGYISPSPAQHLVSIRGWNSKITHAYHMGCYASIPAIRMAEAFVQTGDKEVDLVHTEMCSLHLNPNIHTPEQMVVQSLFADGYIRYQARSQSTQTSGLKVLGILERVLPESEADMTWITADSGMHMTLSREIPDKISKHVEAFLQTLCLNTGEDYDSLIKEGIFAIHPGGPKIIDSVESKLKLAPWQTEASKSTLFHYGNMSSATLPHVWKKVLETAVKKQKVVSLAFGPGLTLFGTLFEVMGGD